MSRDVQDADEPIEHWPPAAPAASLAAPPRGSWWGQVLRSLAFLPVDWRGLRTTPGRLALFVLLLVSVGVVIERLYIVGPADFQWEGLLAGWFATLVSVWLAWWLAERAARSPDAPHGSALFALWTGQGAALLLAAGAVYVPLQRQQLLAELPPLDAWLLWLAVPAWLMAAQLAVVWRLGVGRAGLLVALPLLSTGLALKIWGPSDVRWLPTAESPPVEERAHLKLSQELFERQPRLLAEQLAALRRGRRGEVELYAIAFAPYGEEDVFKREAELVDATMRERFGAQGRSVRLVNNPATAAALPWATPLNLERAIEAAAAAMNRDEDILFLHLTSHGGRDGKLAAALWPLQVEEVTPQQLRAWLDAAGVRHRVISISACYSGSWIAPLADEHTLVMTAADAEHTSYGCGRLSELTFFGRAMYGEQLRETRSFEQAHAQAREVIALREKEAGKDDGYSNPQISMGTRARAQLERLERALQR